MNNTGLGDLAEQPSTEQSPDAGVGDQVSGDKIVGSIGDVGPGAQIAIGKDIRQTGAISTLTLTLTLAERTELVRLLTDLKANLASTHVVEKQRVAGEAMIEQLQEELMRTDAYPDGSLVRVASSWLLRHVPALAGTLTHFFLNPIVTKVVESSGDVAAE